jgi:hypothetical protein
MTRPLNFDDKLGEGQQYSLTQLETFEIAGATEEWLKNKCLLTRISWRREDWFSAINHAKDALGKCSRQTNATFWAEASFLVGVSYAELPGNKFLHLQLVITHLENAEEVYTQWDYPEKWIDVTSARQRINLQVEELKAEGSMNSVWGPVKVKVDNLSCFVMMPFNDPTVSSVYEQIIKPTIEEHSLIPKRADSFMTATSIFFPSVSCGLSPLNMRFTQAGATHVAPRFYAPARDWADLDAAPELLHVLWRFGLRLGCRWDSSGSDYASCPYGG